MLKIEYNGISLLLPPGDRADQVWAAIITAAGQRQGKPKLETRARETASNGSQGKKYPLGSRRWTEAEQELVIKRDTELEAQGIKRKNRKMLIGRELGRTAAGIGVKLWLIKKGKTTTTTTTTTEPAVTPK